MKAICRINNRSSLLHKDGALAVRPTAPWKSGIYDCFPRVPWHDWEEPECYTELVCFKVRISHCLLLTLIQHIFEIC